MKENQFLYLCEIQRRYNLRRRCAKRRGLGLFFAISTLSGLNNQLSHCVWFCQKVDFHLQGWFSFFLKWQKIKWKFSSFAFCLCSRHSDFSVFSLLTVTLIVFIFGTAFLQLDFILSSLTMIFKHNLNFSILCFWLLGRVTVFNKLSEDQALKFVLILLWFY